MYGAVRQFLILMLITLFGVFGFGNALAEGKQVGMRGEQHRVPKVPVIIDGIKRPATDVLKYNGRPLYFTVSEQAQPVDVLYVFTSQATFDAHIRAQGRTPATASFQDIRPLRRNYDGIETHFIESHWYIGCSLDLLTGGSIADLSQFSKCGNGNWNNAISSVQAASSGGDTYLYTWPSFGGSILRVPAGRNMPDLELHGFDNITSSVKVMP